MYHKLVYCRTYCSVCRAHVHQSGAMLLLLLILLAKLLSLGAVSDPKVMIPGTLNTPHGSLPVIAAVTLATQSLEGTENRRRQRLEGAKYNRRFAVANVSSTVHATKGTVLKGFFGTNCTILSRADFNSMFGADVVVLPAQMIAQGFDKGDCFQYKNYKDLKVAQTINSRYRIFLSYWRDNIDDRRSKYYFVLTWSDGYRTGIPRLPNEKDELRLCNFSTKEFASVTRVFEGQEEVDAARTCYPVLHRHISIMAMSAHTNDHYTLLVPDTRYIETNGYKELRESIDKAAKSFENRTKRAIYRGSPSLGPLSNVIVPGSTNGMTQRNYLWHLQKTKFIDIDINTNHMTAAEQVSFRFIIDVEGTANSWAATFWKLYSGSVLLKADGMWKQWYYDKIEAWKHFVPVAQNFSDLTKRIQWCIDHEADAKRIAKNAREFVLKELSWERVLNLTRRDIWTRVLFPKLTTNSTIFSLNNHSKSANREKLEANLTNI